MGSETCSPKLHAPPLEEVSAHDVGLCALVPAGRTIYANRLDSLVAGSGASLHPPRQKEENNA